MTAAVASHFDTVLIGNTDQGIDLPIAGVVPHLGNQFIGAAHGMNDTKCNIMGQDNFMQTILWRGKITLKANTFFLLP